jgi:hypothetical protein
MWNQDNTRASKRQKEDLVLEVFRLACLCDQLKVANTAADGGTQLMCVDNAAKRDVFLLTARSLSQQIIVL